MKEMPVLVTACILYIRQYQRFRASGKSYYSLPVSKGNKKNSSTLLKMMKLNSRVAV